MNKSLLLGAVLFAVPSISFGSGLDVSGVVSFNYRSHHSSTLHKYEAEIWTDVDFTFALTQTLRLYATLEDHSGHSYDTDNYTHLIQWYADYSKDRWKVSVGRYWEHETDEAVIDRELEQVRLTYGNSFKVWGYVGRKGNFYENNKDRLYVLGVRKTLKSSYFQTNFWKSEDKRIYSVEVNKSLKNWAFNEKVTFGEHHNGLVSSVVYKQMNPSVPNSYSVWARYFHQPEDVYLFPTYDCNWFMGEGGYKGYGVGIDYCPMKNSNVILAYYDTRSIETSSRDKVIYTELNYYF